VLEIENRLAVCVCVEMVVGEPEVSLLIAPDAVCVLAHVAPHEPAPLRTLALAAAAVAYVKLAGDERRVIGPCSRL
jgi:hypothetical protein